jgi:hypothetical protein
MYIFYLSENIIMVNRIFSIISLLRNVYFVIFTNGMYQ